MIFIVFKLSSHLLYTANYLARKHIAKKVISVEGKYCLDFNIEISIKTVTKFFLLNFQITNLLLEGRQYVPLSGFGNSFSMPAKLICNMSTL